MDASWLILIMLYMFCISVIVAAVNHVIWYKTRAGKAIAMDDLPLGWYLRLAGVSEGKWTNRYGKKIYLVSTTGNISEIVIYAVHANINLPEHFTLSKVKGVRIVSETTNYGSTDTVHAEPFNGPRHKSCSNYERN